MRGGKFGIVAFGAALTPMLILLGSCVAPSDAAEVGDGAGNAGDDVQARPAASPASTSASTAPVAPAVPTISIAPTQRLAQGSLVRGSVWPANSTLTLNGAPVVVAPNGLFIIGFDRDAPAQATLRMVPRTGAPVVRQLTIAPGQWAIQQINAPTRGAARSDAEFERRRPAELAQMAAARRTVVTNDGWRQRFIWPVSGRISGVFGSQRVYQGVPGSYHNGVDVAAPTGTPLLAPADGVVILAAAAPFTLEGNLLMVDHGAGLSSVFMHNSRLDVHTGDIVRQGQVMGLTGATGRVTGPHMHWAMRWNGVKIDAAAVVGPMTATSTAAAVAAAASPAARAPARPAPAPATSANPPRN
jgi:murein DD-endopeptidase MepM/ murein hydrolase activator NlpD